MGFNLTNEQIDQTFQQLTQISGSVLVDGTGSLIEELTVTASYANEATTAQTATNAVSASIADTATLALITVSASYAINASNSDSSSYSVTAVSSSFANVSISASYSNVAETANTASYILGNNVDGPVAESVTSVSASHALVADVALTANTVTLADSALHTVVNVKNVSGGEIQKGTPLFVTDSGTSGELAGVIPADAGNHDLMPATLIAGETLVNGAEGVGYTDGLITGVPTGDFFNGDEVYVAVGGGYTRVAPTGSARVQHIGNITKIHPSNGAGVIHMSGEDRHNPNLGEGLLWVGDSTNGEPITVPTSSLSVANAVSASYALTASYATTASYAINAGQWDGQYTGDAGITGSLTFTGTSAILDMGTGIAAQIKANNITGSWGQTNGTHTLQIDGNVSTTTGFTGSLNGNADTATNLTPGAKSHDGVIQQTVPMPALFGETDFYTVTGANAGVYHVGLQDYTGFGVKFAHQGYMSEQFDSAGFNYGTAMGNSLTGVGFFMITSGSGEQVGLLTEQVPGQSKTTTDLSGHTTTLRGIDNVQLSGSVFSQNDITAPNFIGNLQGNANTATNSVSSSYSTVAENLTPGSKTFNGNINQTFNAGNVGLTTINGAAVGATAYNNFTVGVQDIPAFGASYEDCYIIECYDSMGYNYGAEFKVNGVAAGFFMYPQTGGFGDPAGVQVIDNGGAGSQVQIYGKSTEIGAASNATTVTVGNTNSTTTMAGDLVLTGLGDYADDATAASNGVPLNGVYRTGNVLKIRIV